MKHFGLAVGIYAVMRVVFWPKTIAHNATQRAAQHRWKRLHYSIKLWRSTVWTIRDEPVLSIMLIYVLTEFAFVQFWANFHLILFLQLTIQLHNFVESLIPSAILTDTITAVVHIVCIKVYNVAVYHWKRYKDIVSIPCLANGEIVLTKFISHWPARSAVS